MKTGNTLATGYMNGEFTFRPIQVRFPLAARSDVCRSLRIDFGGALMAAVENDGWC